MPNIPMDARSYVKFVTESSFLDRNVQCEVSDNRIFLSDMLNSNEVEIDFNRYQQVIDEVNACHADDLILSCDNGIEVALRYNFQNSLIRYPDQLLSGFHRKSNVYSPYLSEVSERYLVYLLYRLAASGNFQPFLRSVGKFVIRADSEIKTFEDFLSLFGRDIFTVRMSKSLEMRPIGQMIHEIDSFLYTICKDTSAMISRINQPEQFNPGMPYGDLLMVRLKSMEVYSEREQVIKAPNDLIYLYQTAFSSTSPEHQFLNFYRIIERQLFSSLYSESLSRVSTLMKSSTFDPGNIQHVDAIARTLMRDLQREESDYKVKEQTALNDVLQRYEVLRHLHDRMLEYGDNIANYFENNSVSFSSGNRFHTKVVSSNNYKNLSQRIYVTRNSIVHNKVLSDYRFDVMKDEPLLRPEVLLVRLVAEIIIENYIPEIQS